MKTVQSVLFTGLGSIGQRHLRNLVSLLGSAVRVSAYRVRGENLVLTDKLEIESADGLEARHGITAYRSLDTALAQRPDAVFVTNPSRFHLSVASAAASARCAVFVEKPISDGWEGVADFVENVERAGVVCAVGYQLRFHPGFRVLKEWIRGNRLGRVVAGRFCVGEYLPNFHRYEDYRRTYAARKDLGGGVVVTQLHEIDAIYGLFGLPERVFAAGGHLSDLEIDVEDVAMAILEFRSSDGRFFPVHLHQDYLQRPTERAWTVVGNDGKAVWNHVTGSLIRYDADGAVAESHDFSKFERNTMFIDELKDFLACVETGARPAVTARDGAASLAIAASIRRSIASGRAETVPSLAEAAK